MTIYVALCDIIVQHWTNSVVIEHAWVVHARRCPNENMEGGETKENENMQRRNKGSDEGIWLKKCKEEKERRLRL